MGESYLRGFKKNAKRVCLATLLSVVLLSSTVSFFASLQSFAEVPAESESWLSGLNFRNIYFPENTEAADGGYQTRIPVRYGPGTYASEEGVISILGKPDFSDVRFTSDDGVSLLDYWQEPQCLKIVKSTRHISAYGTYDAFGFAVQISANTIMYFYRQGTSHAFDEGQIVMCPYTISTQNWGKASLVFSDMFYDCRNVGGGIIGNSVYLFFSRMNCTNPRTIIDIGFIRSSDLTCSSWSSYAPLHFGWGSPYGHLVQKGSTNTWYMPFYCRNGTNNVVRLFRSNDGGNTWGLGSIVYSGSAGYDESCAQWCGSNRIIILSRNSFGGPLHQFISVDGGDTWADGGDSNLGDSGVDIPWIIGFGSDFLHVSWTDRKANRQMVSQAAIDQIFLSPGAYPEGIILYDLGVRTLLGYCSLVPLDDASVFYVLADEQNANEAAIINGLYDVETVFWVKLPNDVAKINAEVFVYYGNSSVLTSTSLPYPTPSSSPVSVNAGETTANATSTKGNSTSPSPLPSPPMEQNATPQTNQTPMPTVLWAVSATVIIIALFSLVLKKTKLPSNWSKVPKTRGD